MKAFFDSKTIRERVLLTGFILVVVAWWGSSLLARTRVLQTDWKLTADNLDEQVMWLKQKDQVDARTAKVTAQLDPKLTYDAIRAYAEVGRMLQGVPVDMGVTKTDTTDTFAIHSFQVTFRRRDFKEVRDFYVELSKKAPYLVIDQATVSNDRSAPGLITAVFRIYSVEILNPATKS